MIRRRRLSCDVRKWSRDLARCVRVIHYIPIIDRGAADLERSTTIDRPSGHLTLGSRRETVLRRQPTHSCATGMVLARSMRASGTRADDDCEVAPYAEVAHACAKRSPDPTRLRHISTLLGGATPSHCESARRRAVGPRRWLSIVRTRTRPRVVRDRSAERLGDVGTLSEILLLSVSSRVGKGLRP